MKTEAEPLRCFRVFQHVRGKCGSLLWKSPENKSCIQSAAKQQHTDDDGDDDEGGQHSAGPLSH